MDRKSKKRTRRAFEKTVANVAMGTFPTLVVAVISATLAVVATLFFVGKLPLLDAYFGRAPATQARPIQYTSFAHPASSAPSVPSADETLTAHSSASAPLRNLVVKKMGGLLDILNKGDAPVKVTRLVINKHEGVALCDTNVVISEDQGGAGYVHVSTGEFEQLPVVVNLGDGISYWYGLCGSTAVEVEIYSDQGRTVFKF